MQTRLNNFTVSFDNSVEFHLLKREIFGSHQYYFETDVENPHIVDVGAHIGLSVLYFKQLYPTASIKAVEPIPENLLLLKENIFWNNLKDVEVIPAAVSDETGDQEFFMDSTSDHWYSTAGVFRGAWSGVQSSKSVDVPIVTLDSLITQHVDLLKMDIEGLEQKVLTKSAEALSKVDRIFMEYHPVPEQNLESLTTWLQEQGYKVRIERKGKRIQSEDAYGLILIKATR